MTTQDFEKKVTLFKKIIDYWFSENPERDSMAARQMALTKVLNWQSLHVDQVAGIVQSLNLPLSPAYQRVLSDFFDAHPEVQRCAANTQMLLREWSRGGFIDFTRESCEAVMDSGMLAYNQEVVEQNSAAQALEAERLRLIEEIAGGADSYVAYHEATGKKERYPTAPLYSDSIELVRDVARICREQRNFAALPQEERRDAFKTALKQQAQQTQEEFQLINEVTGRLFTRYELLRAEKQVFVDLLYFRGSPRPDFKIREAAINKILRGR